MKLQYKNVILGVCLFNVFLFVSCSTNKNEKINVHNIQTTEIAIDSTCFSDVYDIEIIKLENNKDCLISRVKKMIVNSCGILIFDDSSLPQVFSFSHNGKYLGKIGRLGHAKHEYDHILDVCSNDKGDSIVFLQYGKLKIFDNKGQYVSTNSIDERYHWEKIQGNTTNGYVCASEYTNAENLLSVCDNSFNVIHNFIDSKNINVKHGSYVWNPIWCSHGKIVFCDFYFSSLYVTDTKTHNTSCYRINTGNIAPEAEIENGISNYDTFMDIAYDGDDVFGHIIHNQRCNYFKFNLETNEFYIYGCLKDWYPTIVTYYDGYFYSELEPSFLLSLDRDHSYMCEKTYKALKEALEPYSKDLNEMDNKYILKLKKK